MKTVAIDVPDEIEEILRNNPELKETLKKELIRKLAFSEIDRGKISASLLDLAVGEEDIALEEEEKVLKDLREKAKNRLDDN